MKAKMRTKMRAHRKKKDTSKAIASECPFLVN